MRKRFFNMIPGPDACCVLLYGYIGEDEDVRAADIVKELLEAAAVYKKIDVRINSLGGEVHTGIAIFNAIRNCQAEITVYVDGVAASIASVVAMCGKPVYMSKYARLMLHSVTGGCYGRKDELIKCADMIEQVETILCTIYAAKTGKTEEEIRAAYFDGQDHWLTAQEALDLGFVDGIYDAEPVPEDSTPQQVYDIYQNRLQNDNKPKQSKMFEKLKTRPGFANCATEEDVLRHVEKLERQAADAATLKTDNATLKAEVDAFKAAEQAAQDAADQKLVKDAFDAGKITDPEQAVYLAALKTDREKTTAALNSKTAKQRVTDAIDPVSGKTTEGAWARAMEKIDNDKLKKQ